MNFSSTKNAVNDLFVFSDFMKRFPEPLCLVSNQLPQQFRDVGFLRFVQSFQYFCSHWSSRMLKYLCVSKKRRYRDDEGDGKMRSKSPLRLSSSSLSASTRTSSGVRTSNTDTRRSYKEKG